MTAASLLAEALDAGLDVSLEGDQLTIEGETDLVQTWLPRLRPFRTELMVRLVESSRLTGLLLEAAMRCCDHHHDDEAGRAAMRDDCLNTPPELRAGLLEHFDKAYPARIRNEG